MFCRVLVLRAYTLDNFTITCYKIEMLRYPLLVVYFPNFEIDSLINDWFVRIISLRTHF